MGFFDSLKDKFPWLFGSHYGIERFAVLFCVLSLAMAGCIGSILIKRGNDKKEQLGTQVMYSTEFTMSKSKATGDVVSVNVSNDKTKALVLLKYRDTTKMSTDAADYQMFLTGTNMQQMPTELKCAPDGTIYVFGNSGYVALYLVDSNGFQSQILDLTIRSDNDFESGEALADEYDGSFAKYDQAKIFFNPGGSGSTTVACLEDNDMSPYHIYESVLVGNQEKAIKADMEACLKELQQAQAHIDAATKTVVDKGLQVPQAPFEIAGDSVITNENGELEFMPASYLPGSVQFDWRNGNISDGYVAEAMAMEGYTDERTYFSEKSAAKAGLETTLRTNDILWYAVDGSAVQHNSVTMDSSVQEKLLNDAMDSLINAWQEFYKAKVKYTVTLPSEMLNLEVSSRDMTSNYTVRSFVDDEPGMNQTLWLY